MALLDRISEFPAVFGDFEVVPEFHSINEFVLIIIDHIIALVRIERNSHHPEEGVEPIDSPREFEEREFLYENHAITERV